MFSIIPSSIWPTLVGKNYRFFWNIWRIIIWIYILLFDEMKFLSILWNLESNTRHIHIKWKFNVKIDFFVVWKQLFRFQFFQAGPMGKFYVLPQFLFTSVETELEYYHQKVNRRVASQFTKWHKTWGIEKYPENPWNALNWLQVCGRPPRRKIGQLYQKILKNHL